MGMPWWFGYVTLGMWLLVVAFAALTRGRQFATFAGIIVGLHSLIAAELAPMFAPVIAVFIALHLAVYVNFLMLTRPRMRPLAYRLLISWPGSFFWAGTLLSMPWAVARALGFTPWGIAIPYALAGIGFIQSLATHEEEIDLVVGDHHADTSQPLPHPRGQTREDRPLRIVQITDPHLGPFMSVARLRRIATDAVQKKPDLICLTGDFLTMESQSDPELLRRAFEPLAAMKGRVFACHGNHDHEAPEVVRKALTANGIILLIDEAAVVHTEAGPVQVVGMDFAWRERAERMQRVCQAHPRLDGTTRIVMLHDPGAFKHLPEGEADLVLSGHTHGGQVGLLSLGLSWTFLRLFGITIPDHGFWARGRDRMYVHRGTGHYGFPLRVGVPAEESILRIHRARA
jgi:predicted MPP superfamily phosphohydrolase